MWYFYLVLNLASLSIPLLFSFHPKLKFYQLWKYFFPAVFIMMCFFIPWDILFTQNKIWEFNEKYISGIHFYSLPLEEWLFFICIPYACMFTLYALKNLAPKIAFSNTITTIIYISLQTILIATLLYFYERWYTAINFGFAIVLMALVYNFSKKILQIFFPVFFILLVPFFIVNGFLTGSWIAEEVVWYNNTENLGIRIGTVPIEDSIYALGMLLTVFALMEKFIEKNTLKT